MRRLGLALLLSGCAQPPPPPVPTPTPLAPPLVLVHTPSPQPQPVLQISPQAKPAPPGGKPRPKPKVVEKPVARPLEMQPAIPRQVAVPVRVISRPTPQAVEASPTATSAPAVDPEAPLEIELVPPEDVSLAPPPPEDPQAVLKTPMAVHYGYTYSRSLVNLERDGILKINLVGSGYSAIDIFVVNQGIRPLHFYFFPGMIFKPEKTTTFCSLMLGEVHEVFLYPNSRDRLRFSCYSLDHKKPFPDERFPVSYRLEPNPDLRYPRALRVMRALLTDVASGREHSDEYGQHRNLIVQLALWQAGAAGRYHADGELAQLLGPSDPKVFQAVRSLVYSEVDKLQREANQF